MYERYQDTQRSHKLQIRVPLFATAFEWRGTKENEPQTWMARCGVKCNLGQIDRQARFSQCCGSHSTDSVKTEFLCVVSNYHDK